MTETRYGREALQLAAQQIGALKVGDPMAPVLVLVPSSAAGVTLRRYLALEGVPICAGRAPGVAAVDITTLPRLAERVAAHLLAPRRPVSQPVVSTAWRRALTEESSAFAEVAEHPATTRAMMQTHRDLRALDDATLDAVAGHAPVSAEVVRLARSVQARLADSFYDERDLLDAAQRQLRHDPLRQPVVLYLPQDVTAPQQRLLEVLDAGTEVVAVVGRTGVRRADQHLSPLTVAGDGAMTVAIPTATHLVTASDSDDEARHVVRQVVATLRAGTPAHRIAVLYSSAEPYARLLHEHLTAAGIAFNGPGTTSVAQRALSRSALTLLALEPDAIPRARLFQALTDAPVRGADGAPVPVSAWERTSRAAGVVGGEDWTTRLQHHQQVERTRADRLEEDDWDAAARWARADADRAKALETFVADLRADLTAARQLTTWRELTAWALDFVAARFGDASDLRRLPAPEQHAAAVITGVLRRMESLDDVGGTASLPRLVEALQSELDAALPRVGRFGEGVLVAPISQSVGLDLDVVHVVGLSEDLCPGRPHVDAVLAEAVRTTVPGLADAASRLARTYRHVLAAFAAAPVAIASFPRGDLRTSGTRLPSRFLLGSMRELSGDHDLVASAWQTTPALAPHVTSAKSFAAELLTTRALATEQEWRVRAAATERLDDVVVAAADAMARARAGAAFTRYDGDLRGVPGLPDWADERRLISPTALESYATCPHGYFVQRLLGVEPIQNPESLVEISPLEIGNLVHQSFDRLVTELDRALPGPGEPWTPQQRHRLVEIADEVGTQMEASGLTGHPRLWQQERQRIAADLDAMLDADDARRADRGAGVLASEMPFGLRGEPPVVLDVDGAPLRLRGSADKVDRGADGRLWVTDIKTGSNRTYLGITADDPLAGGSKLQLPVYALAAQQRYGDAGTPVHAEYWFVRKDHGVRGIDVDDAVHGAYRHTLGVLARSMAAGLFPPRPPAEADYLFVSCHYCNPDGIGHGLARERWERQRSDPALAELVGLVEPDALTAMEVSP